MFIICMLICSCCSGYFRPKSGQNVNRRTALVLMVRLLCCDISPFEVLCHKFFHVSVWSTQGSLLRRRTSRGVNVCAFQQGAAPLLDRQAHPHSSSAVSSTVVFALQGYTSPVQNCARVCKGFPLERG